MSVIAPPLLAQSADPEADPQVAERLAAAKTKLSVETVQDRCRSARKSGEIVVCVDRGEDLRVPSTAESDPSSLAARRALNNRIPRAPQLDRGSCKGQPGCVVGGWAPAPIYVIDPSALPQAPEGSDADKIAKGEMPDR
ncbi:hypothetical protein [Novosphingobium ginsenosidimutans]|uniref:Uncharacterized protein n=1 Tax=Novosphingobium ginsenosidimutans TaxID=1176536 RepID=A0A5B8S3M4_9SPHN|nr:hypothetical protein [Novosphingobium ginsenosidimutans]QEA15893.1 hypothetical protein FRF71_06910 [Novosphingobium ginsenosidimutans]